MSDKTKAGEEKTVTKVIEEVIEEICDKYCKYPEQALTEDKDEDWLICDPDSPCNTCPFNRLM